MAPDDDAHKPDGIPASMSGPVLLIEDNAIIALDTEETLRSMGIGIVISVGNPSQALAAIAAHSPTFALLDINLGVDNGFSVADALIRANIPFVFATGYIDQIALPARFASAPIISKPYTTAVLRAALARQFPTRLGTTSDHAGNGRDDEQNDKYPEEQPRALHRDSRDATETD